MEDVFAEVSRNNAVSMLKQHKQDADDISRYSGLSKSEIIELKKSMNL